MSNINTPPRSRVARRIRAAAAAITVGLAAGALTVTPASAADNAYIGQAPEGMTELAAQAPSFKTGVSRHFLISHYFLGKI